MATNKEEICNSALAKLGALRITSFTSDMTEHAKLCRALYDVNRKSLLREHPWNFASKTTAWTKNVTPPTDLNFGSAFDMPADWLRTVKPDLDDEEDWREEGNQILCNATALDVKYVYDLQDVTKFTSDFAELFSLMLARDMAYALTQSASMRAQLDKEYSEKLPKVRSMDAQGSSTVKVTANRFKRARYNRR